MKSKGFTLIELLIVIAIMALLLGMVLPALKIAKERSLAVLCQTNIKKITQGLYLYAGNNGTFPYSFDSSTHGLAPPPGGYVGNPMFDRMGWWWFHNITESPDDLTGVSSIFRCPSRCIEDLGIKENILWGNYGVNQSICRTAAGIPAGKDFIGIPLGLDQIPDSSKTLLIFDCGYSMATWWQVTNKPPQPLGSTVEENAYIPGLNINDRKILLPGQKYDALNARHLFNGVNVGFVDGHVELLQVNGLYVENINDIYKNRCPLWQPANPEIIKKERF